MASDARYSAFEHGGLEVAQQQESGLEVIPDDTTAPEVVPGSRAPLDRRSSLDQPETLHPGQYETNTAYSDNASVPPYVDNDASYHGGYGKEGATATPLALESGPSAADKPKRYCGMGKKPFTIVLIVAIVVILAAILGGVLGGVYGSRRSSDSTSSPPLNNGSSLNSSTINTTPLVALPQTGLATVPDADGTGRLVTYYQDKSGHIYENSYLNGRWTLDDPSNLAASLVTTSAQLGTSIAAVSYNLTGRPHRQIFFYDGSGRVQSTNSSSRAGDGSQISTGWTVPVTIASDRAGASSVAMAACADTAEGGMTGIRMYYGSGNGTIQEVGYNFSAPAKGWTEWEQFYQSDPSSGVDCTVYNPGSDRFISVYFRNASTGFVQQAVWNYRFQNGWTAGPATDVAIVEGSDVAACSDGQMTDYVFYQIPGGTITRAMVQPAATSDFLSYANQQTASLGSRLSAAYVEGGSLYVFQNSTSDPVMWAENVSRGGNVISAIAIP